MRRIERCNGAGEEAGCGGEGGRAAQTLAMLICAVLSEITGVCWRLCSPLPGAYSAKELRRGA